MSSSVSSSDWLRPWRRPPKAGLTERSTPLMSDCPAFCDERVGTFRSQVEDVANVLV